MHDWFCFYEPDYTRCWHGMIKADDIDEAKDKVALWLKSHGAR